MAPRLFKVWSVTGEKKAVIASTLQELKQKGAAKLQFSCPEKVDAYMEDGTHVDEDDILHALDDSTVLYLCLPGQKPGQKVSTEPLTPDIPRSSSCQVNDYPSQVSTPDGGSRCGSINVSISDSGSESDSTESFRPPWPRTFKINSEQFSEDLKLRIQQGMSAMNRQTRHELLNVLAEQVARYTLNPDHLQRRQVVKSLIELYPSLRSTRVDPYNRWSTKLYEKMKEVRKSRLGTDEEPPVRKQRDKFNSTGSETEKLEKDWMAVTKVNAPLTETSSFSLLDPTEPPKLPWPQTFKINSEKFSKDLKLRMYIGMSAMSWQARHELLNILADEVAKYTLNPDHLQRRQVAQVLINDYPSLKSEVCDPYGSWPQRLYDKMKDVRSKLGTEESTVKRKRKFCTESSKHPRRGEANWAPSCKVDLSLVEKSKAWLLAESRKPREQQNESKMKIHLEITFAVRRKSFQQIPPVGLLEMKQQYPLLFSPLGLKIEFELLQGIDPTRILENLEKCALTIIIENEKKVSRKKACPESSSELSTKNKKLDKLRSELLSSLIVDVRSNLCAAFLLLPVLLNEESEYVYRIMEKCGDVHSAASESSSPIITFVGNPMETGKIYICGEGNILVELENPLQAIWALFCLYYACNIEYPSNAICTFLFMQCYLLKIHHSRKFPGKLNNLIEKL